MKYTNNSTIRVCSIFLVVILMFTAFPSSAFAAIDEPLNGTTGSGWDDFGGLPGGGETGLPPVMTEPPDGDDPEGGELDSGNNPDNDSNNLDALTESESGTATPTGIKGEIASATPGTSLGVSGPILDLPPGVEEEFLAFLAAVESIIENPPLFMPAAAPGDTGTISWVWGDPVGYTTTAGHYIGSLPRLTLSTSNPAQDIPFCAKFGVDPNTSSPYTAKAGSNQQILKLLIAHKEGKASTVGTQLAIWSITNHTSFRSHAEAQAAWSAAASVSTDGYSYLEWSAGSGQPFYTLEGENAPTEWTLKIIKKSTSGKLLPDAEFSISGPGVDKTGLVTNEKGEILVDIAPPGGTYTVTETTPPDGYHPADPDSQTVTIDAANPSGTVVFENEPEIPEEEEPGESSFRIEVEVEVVTDVEVRNEKEIEYSRAYGQVTIRKHDQDGKSLDGALFNIEAKRNESPGGICS